ncbi:rRNA maturation RNase YbeY [Paenirhodobacter sp.]|uniref:rRNA maturation RNase YbeY n=1 Tax=Paenirhodobacter sp. TaxID=1965326 RepID=UPI003D0B3785
MTATMSEPLVDILIEDGRWEEIDLPALSERAARATLADQELVAAEWEISLLGCDDARIAVLNGEHRAKPKPTNVLSWPAQDLASEEDGGEPYFPEPFVPGERDSLGDIAIAFETCAREAVEGNIPLADHVTHLIVHGVLHLLGYDHVRDADATLMEAIEVRILAQLGIGNPYER